MSAVQSAIPVAVHDELCRALRTRSATYAACATLHCCADCSIGCCRAGGLTRRNQQTASDWQFSHVGVGGRRARPERRERRASSRPGGRRMAPTASSD